MRILHTSDWHVGRTIRGRSRHHEHEAVLDGMLDLVEQERVDLVLVAGDQFDAAVPPAAAERLVWRTLVGFAERGARVVLVAGNHDNAAKLEALAPVLARGGDITVAAHVQRPGDGGVARVETANGEARVALVPFLSQRGIVKTADLLQREAGQHAQAYADRVKRVLAHLCDGFGSGGTVDLVLAHLTVVGTGKLEDSLGGGERASHVLDYVVPPQVFPSEAHYAALGHLHQPHDVKGAPCPARYSGSPLHLDFGEVASERGVTIVEASPSEPARPRHRPLTGGYGLLTLHGTLEQLEAAAADLGEEVYVRAVVDEAPRAGLAEEVRALVPQAVDVRVADARRGEDEDDELDAEAAAADPAALFSQYLEARGIDDERVPKLFRTLLDEVQAAERGGEPVGAEAGGGEA